MAERMRDNLRGAGRDYEAIRRAIDDIPNDPRVLAAAQQGSAAASAVMTQLREYHKERFAKSMRRALGLRIDLFSDSHVAPIIEQAIRDNVDLIKTIPPRYHDALKREFRKLAVDAPFDQAAVRKMLATGYRSAGYNLRRLTRDQTTKTIGKLTEARQTGVGITQYQWLTSQDERVRSSHVAKSGRIFEWASPPADTGHPGHDIQCRCTAIAIVPRVRARGAVPSEPGATVSQVEVGGGDARPPDNAAPAGGAGKALPAAPGHYPESGEASARAPPGAA